MADVQLDGVAAAARVGDEKARRLPSSSIVEVLRPAAAGDRPVAAAAPGASRRARERSCARGAAPARAAAGPPPRPLRVRPGADRWPAMARHSRTRWCARSSAFNAEGGLRVGHRTVEQFRLQLPHTPAGRSRAGQARALRGLQHASPAATKVPCRWRAGRRSGRRGVIGHRGLSPSRSGGRRKPGPRRSIMPFRPPPGPHPCCGKITPEPPP